MKVCLVNPPHPYLKQPKAQAPLGMLYVAASLRKNNIPVEFIDLTDKQYEDVFELPEADIYGITGTVIDRKAIECVAKQIKARFPNSKTAVGGPIALTPQYLDCTCVDTVVLGEGEYTILDLVDAFPNWEIRYRAARILDLDKVPFPARDMLQDIGGNVFAFNKNYKDGGSTVIITSRGCPYSCAFCASPGIWNRKVVLRSVENVLAEVDEVKEKFNISQLRFSDDTLTLDTRRLRELCQGLKARDVVWRASIRVKPNGVDMFNSMYDAGCREVSFGVESADQDVLDVLHKGTTVLQNKEAIINAKKAGLVVRILFMIGTPGETAETIDKNISFLTSVHNHYDTIALTNFIPIPGSAIAENPEEYDCEVLSRNIDEYNFYMWTPDGMNQWKEFIKLNNMSLEEQHSNKERMRQFIVASGKSNHG